MTVSLNELEGVEVPRTTCFTDSSHARDALQECPECHRYFCAICMNAHGHSSDELYVAAQKLKGKHPRCADAIDRELATLRERGRMGEFQSVAGQLEYYAAAVGRIT